MSARHCVGQMREERLERTTAKGKEAGGGCFHPTGIDMMHRDSVDGYCPV